MADLEGALMTCNTVMSLKTKFALAVQVDFKRNCNKFIVFFMQKKINVKLISN